MKYTNEGGPYSYKYPMVAGSSTLVIIKRPNRLLLTKRSMSSDSYPGYWAFCGGFLDAGKETLEECAVREVFEEVGLQFSVDQIKLFDVRSRPDVDVRAHTVNACWYVFMEDEQEVSIDEDEISEYMWLSVDSAKKMNLAFDHNLIIIKLEEMGVI